MLLKLSPLLLFFTLPLYPSTPYAGLPLWAWVSLSVSLIYALFLIVGIDKTFSQKSKIFEDE